MYILYEYVCLLRKNGQTGRNKIKKRKMSTANPSKNFLCSSKPKLVNLLRQGLHACQNEVAIKMACILYLSFYEYIFHGFDSQKLFRLFMTFPMS